MKKFLEIQKKKLNIDERDVRPRAKKVELEQKEICSTHRGEREHDGWPEHNGPN
jgi:hypothetical protein